MGTTCREETMHTEKSLRLTEAGADAIVRAAVAKAREIGVSMSIAIVDSHCVGGIGVSGGLGEQDVLVAQAGLFALGARA
jgi:uncharacterized protein GlcG (DUF336 family)